MSHARPLGGISCVVLSGMLATGCGVRAERSTLDQFFTASRLRDRTALASFATVTFEPLEQGIVVDFEIQKVTEHEASTNVTIAASIRQPDGAIVPRILTIVMERVRNPQAGPRWRITGFAQHE